LRTRGTSFGYGERSGNEYLNKRKKSVISNPLESPSPDRYELKLGFDSLITSSKINSHNKSFCFATGREAYDRVFMPGKSN